MPDADVTELLRRISRGEKSAESDLIPLVYRELHRLAAAHLRRERSGHTLQATALVHEVYLRLTRHHEADWKDRAHFFATASRCMRQILVDYARRRSAGKRGGPATPLTIADGLQISDEQSVLVLQIDQALERLERINPRHARIVELRFFVGLSEEEIGEVIGIASRTVKRDWALARAWLYGELRG